MSLRAARSSEDDVTREPTVDDAVSTDGERVQRHAPSEHEATIIHDMHAHLQRRRAREDADLIKAKRNPLVSAATGFLGFFRSKYLANVKKSVGLLIAGWLWLVVNTKTYTPPDYDD